MIITNRFKKYTMALVCLFVLLWAMPSHAGKVTYQYDDLGRLEQVSYHNGPVVKYYYDQLGNMMGREFKSMVLHVNTDGPGVGTVTASPEGYSCGTGCYIYDVTTPVTLTAVPAADNELASWSEPACPDPNAPCTISVDSMKIVTATFRSRWVTLNVSKNGSGGGTITSNPAGINCGADCSENYYRGTSITLSAAADPNSEFSGWAGAGCSGVGDCSFTISDETSVVAVFAPVVYPVKLARTPAVNYARIQDAYDAAIEGDVILVEGTILYEDVSLDRNISVSIEGGYSPDFSNVVGTTTLYGDIDIVDGNANIGNFVLE